jgi:zinc transport system substrate-binding protein
MSKYGRYSVLALLLAALVAGCGERSADQGASEPEAPGQLIVITVNYPLAYFAERILGDAGRVSFPAPADIDPAYWSPEPAVISEYQQADLIILNGAGYAGWVANATLPSSRLVDTTAAVSDRLIPIERRAPCCSRSLRPGLSSRSNFGMHSTPSRPTSRL